MSRSKSAKHGTAPKSERRHRWTGRDRAGVRMAAISARGEHRAGLEIYTDFPTLSHRHNAAWSWH